MKLEAILFDLDGTLLPMNNDEFTKGYLALLAKTVSPLGYTADTMIPAMWRGVSAMIKNDGSEKNSDVFWRVFGKHLQKDAARDIPRFDAFYDNEFHKAVAFTQPTSSAPRAVALAKQKAERVILATNPFFPRAAVRSRLRWAGLLEEDFDLITDYDNSRFCKPNPAYYHEILSRWSLSPDRCLMIGNNADEDIAAAQAAGLSTFLLTDCLIASGDTLPDTESGSFDELLRYLETL